MTVKVFIFPGDLIERGCTSSNKDRPKIKRVTLDPGHRAI